MGFRVLKAFASHNRRFAIGDEIPEGEDLGVHTLESAKAAGLVGGGSTAQPVFAKTFAKGDDE